MRPANAQIRHCGQRASVRDAGAQPMASKVSSLDVRRIERGLQARTRYKYVQPRVVREGVGWKVVSENCSRNIDAEGGEVDITWLVPHSEGGWLLYSRDHAQDCWQLRPPSVSLAAVLDRLCADQDREFRQ